MLMKTWQKIQSGFRALFRKEKLDREMDEEMRAHVELRTQVNIDAWVLAISGLVSLASGLIFGLAPALRATKTDLNECLKEGGGVRGFARSRASRLRHSLVVGEIALSLVLLVGAGLLLKSFVLLSHVRLGFEPRKLLVVELGGMGPLPSQALLERLSALPGVQAVAATDDLPMSEPTRINQVTVEGEPPSAAEEKPVVYEHFVTPDYFRAMGIPLVKGQPITERDAEGTPAVVVVNESFVRRLLGGADPIGKRLGDEKHHMIVGVVGDVKQGVLEQEMHPQVYYSSRQEQTGAKYLVVRTRTEPMQLAGSIRAVIRSVDKTRQIGSTQTMEDRIAHSIVPQRFQTSLVTLFSGVGLLLAAVGIYGVVSYSVAQRIREFGIRMAVGAQRRDILQLVVRQALWLVTIGVGLGLLGALALTRVLKSFLFQVGTTDPVTFVAVSVFLAGVALFASYVPARRAARVDPMMALRCE
jgi:putative ABC transport system permease protein